MCYFHSCRCSSLQSKRAVCSWVKKVRELINNWCHREEWWWQQNRDSSFSGSSVVIERVKKWHSVDSTMTVAAVVLILNLTIEINNLKVGWCFKFYSKALSVKLHERPLKKNWSVNSHINVPQFSVSAVCLKQAQHSVMAQCCHFKKREMTRGRGNPTQRMTPYCHSAVVLIALLCRFCSMQEDRAASILIINGVCWIRHKLLSASANVYGAYTSDRWLEHTHRFVNSK